MKQYILALDQGTTSTRAMIFGEDGQAVTSAQLSLSQHYPRPGWVEHDPMEILTTQVTAAAQAFERSGLSPAQIAGIGLANQRETAIIWEKATGRPICPAIVWQCRRTAAMVDALAAGGAGEIIRERTGLIPDAYFSGTKYAWMLDNIPGARTRAEAGQLLCGTVDSWLIWNLTGAHVTDLSNACRTLLLDIHTLSWDPELCTLLRVPMAMLPRPVGNSEVYGVVKPHMPGLEALAGVPVCGSAGDQQAALFGHGCFEPGQAKNTYGTGCFALMNTGGTPVTSRHGLLASVGWHIGGRTAYVLEGSVFNAGSAIQWLRDEMGIIGASHEVSALAESVDGNGGVYMVPAFTGLGAPHWDMYARGAVLGLTRGSGRAHLARAVLEGIAYQVHDLLEAIALDAGARMEALWVDGGASSSDFLMQFQADILGIPLCRPVQREATAAGAAWLAGLAAGLWREADIPGLWALERRFEPGMSRAEAQGLLAGWRRAVARAKDWEERA